MTIYCQRLGREVSLRKTRFLPPKRSSESSEDPSDHQYLRRIENQIVKMVRTGKTKQFLSLLSREGFSVEVALNVDCSVYSEGRPPGLGSLQISEISVGVFLPQGRKGKDGGRRPQKEQMLQVGALIISWCKSDHITEVELEHLKGRVVS